MYKVAEELMAQSIPVLLTKKFGNEFGTISWSHQDAEHTNTLTYHVLNSIKEKTLQQAAATAM